jgi:hypothetical protein
MLIADQGQTNHRYAMPQRLCHRADAALSYQSMHMGQHLVMGDESHKAHICRRLEFPSLQCRPERDQSADGQVSKRHKNLP